LTGHRASILCGESGDMEIKIGALAKSGEEHRGRIATSHFSNFPIDNLVAYTAVTRKRFPSSLLPSSCWFRVLTALPQSRWKQRR
jgi:hypothetical protein